MRKKAVVSGGTKGIGRAIVFALIREGYDIATGASTVSDLMELQKSVRNINPEADVLIKACDFAVKSEALDFAGHVLERWGGADVIINNVGMYTTGSISEETNEQLENQMNINFFSAYYLTIPFLPVMKSRKCGFIFNICSVVNKFPRAEAASYTISKNALKSFNDVLREEMRAYNVKVTAILPGPVNTSSWEGINAPEEEFVQPEDIASIVINGLNLSDRAFLEEVVINPVNRNQ